MTEHDSALFSQPLEGIERAVKQLLKTDDGHGFDHVRRVTDMGLTFARQENANLEVVELAALLHDVDDYKLFGEESAKNLTNARKILDENSIDESTKTQVLDIIANMGYSKYLAGIRPKTLEGKIVSDADMCDAIGAQGILRTHAYNASKGNAFFDPSIAPLTQEQTAEQYKNAKSTHAAQHFFDKLLLINSILMTDAGREEGAKRQKIMVDFLRELFREEGANEWLAHLDNTSAI